MMHRSGWAAKPGQERVLAIEITRADGQDDKASDRLEGGIAETGKVPAIATSLRVLPVGVADG